ncbi:ABC transporter permease [Actinomadura alba]|uniref:ABC transporter permease n=1 Tax=Actinomadura alba TaxID=406431 RepID=A0ABR7LHM0_9ACTN|nr:ABC transporter permease [Actinomadura alba]MBC6464359.1 ABC transporter permease [Actinomadura alba]
MIWLTWRQFRAAAAATAAALAALAAVLAITGPGLADDYATGLTGCTTQSDGCSRFLQNFFHDNQAAFLGLTAVMLALPALTGLFWGAPMITRELEAGTHRLVWNQSITRTRWLAIKLGLTGLAAMAAAGLASLAVSWWSGPIDKAAAANEPGFPRMGTLLFDVRGIVPIGYAAFAFVLGVTVGMLVRRTLPAMAITLAVFAAVQVAMPLLVRPYLRPPVHATVEISMSNLEGLGFERGGGPLRLQLRTLAPDKNGWALSSRLVDTSGNTVSSTVPVSTTSGPCAPDPARGPSACFAELKRLGYRQEVSYHPSSRFWAFQRTETGIYTILALGLAGFCFRRLRRVS